MNFRVYCCFGDMAETFRITKLSVPPMLSSASKETPPNKKAKVECDAVDANAKVTRGRLKHGKQGVAT